MVLDNFVYYIVSYNLFAIKNRLISVYIIPKVLYYTFIKIKRSKSFAYNFQNIVLVDLFNVNICNFSSIFRSSYFLKTDFVREQLRLLTLISVSARVIAKPKPDFRSR